MEFQCESESCSVLSNFIVHGILQARILEGVAFPFSRGSSPPRSPALQVDSLPAEPQGKPKNTRVGSLGLLQWIFPTQESNQGHLHSRWILYQLSYQGSPGIPAEVSQILKHDAVKVMHSVYHHILKFSGGHRTGKGQFSFQSQRKALPKNVQTTTKLHLFHRLAK